MRKVTIEVTEEQERFLKLFAQNHYEGAKDNLGTQKPLHLVQTRKERRCEEGEEDKVVYWSGDDYCDYANEMEFIQAYYRHMDCPIPIVSFDEAYNADEFIGVDGEGHVICSEKDYFEAYGIDKKEYDKAYIEYYYETVAYFFILEEARRYKEYQKHNLTEPRTYTVDMGYANSGEYEHFFDLLIGLGKTLNEDVVCVDGSGTDESKRNLVPHPHNKHFDKRFNTVR